MFYIRDCHEQIVGNPKGYATMRGATAQQNNARTKAYRAIWAAYDARTQWYEMSCMPMPLRRRNICSIRLEGDE